MEVEQFVEPVPEDLICPVSERVITQPVVTRFGYLVSAACMDLDYCPRCLGPPRRELATPRIPPAEVRILQPSLRPHIPNDA